MFTAIAPHYDFLNHALSLNIDKRWRKQAIDRLGWQAAPGGDYLDLCAGTLDLAAELACRPGFRGRVWGADFVVPMLKLGRTKARVIPVAADALKLPFPDESFDGLTVGFGVRNLEDIGAGLAEMARVIKPGGRLVVLEFTVPPSFPMRQLYLLYFTRVLPRLGRLVSHHNSAYSYLPDSVMGFPDPPEFSRLMEQAGFTTVNRKLLTFGIAALYWGTRREPDGVDG